MLIVDQGQNGANSRPPEAAEAANHGDTAPNNGHRAITATAAPTTAATASANSTPVAAGTAGSGPISTNNTVNAARTASARAANRRSQPRTVSAGRPSAAAIARQPAPAAFPASAAPITSTRSARRANATTGNNTCVAPQLRQHARRGRTHTLDPTARSTRGRAHPHGANRPSHPGHDTPPAASRRSTEPESTSTVSTAPPCATHGPPGNSAKR